MRLDQKNQPNKPTMRALFNNPKHYLTLFSLAIFVVSYVMLIEVKPVPQTWPIDKVQHAVIFAALTFLGLESFPRHWLKIIFGLAVYGGLIELLQTQLTLTRNGSVFDWLADSSGLAFGYCLFKWINTYLNE